MEINMKNKKRKVIKRSELPRFNEGLSKLPMPAEHNGKRKRWVGIGWVVEEEYATGEEPLLIIDD